MMTPPFHSRTGYTLLELVLAAGISVLVMAGISSAILIIYQVQSAAGRQISTAQLGRNLLHQLQRDLHSIPGTMPEAAASSSTETDTSEMLQSANEEAASFTTQSEEEMSAYAYWFFGDTTSLEFLAEPTRRTGRSLSLTADPESVAAEQQTRRRLVRWGVSDYQSLGLVDSDSASTEPIVRAEGFTDAWISETTWTEGLPVPEIFAFEFSYFDGESWLEEWDSETLGGLPQAIEVVLTLQPPAETRDNEEVNTSLQWSMRQVMTIPTQRFRTLAPTETETGF